MGKRLWISWTSRDGFVGWWFCKGRFVECLSLMLEYDVENGCKPTFYRLLKDNDGKMNIQCHGSIQTLGASCGRYSLAMLS